MEQLARVVRHNVVRPMAHGKRLDVLDSVCGEFGARERAGNRLMAGPAGHTRRCAACIQFNAGMHFFEYNFNDVVAALKERKNNAHTVPS